MAATLFSWRTLGPGVHVHTLWQSPRLWFRQTKPPPANSTPRSTITRGAFWGYETHLIPWRMLEEYLLGGSTHCFAIRVCCCLIWMGDWEDGLCRLATTWKQGSGISVLYCGEMVSVIHFNHWWFISQCQWLGMSALFRETGEVTVASTGRNI